MFLICPILLLSLATSSYGYANKFVPSKQPIHKTYIRPSTKNATKPDVLNHDFSSLVLGRDSEKENIPTIDSGSDSSLQKKIEEATVPLELTIANLTKTNKQLKSQLSNLKEVNSHKAYQKQKCSAATKQVKSLTTKLSKAEGEVKTLTTDLSNAEEEVKAKRSEKLELKTQLDKTVEQLKTTKKSDKSMTALTMELSKAKAEVKSLVTELSNAEGEVKTKESEKRKLKTTLDKAVKQLEAASKSQERGKSQTSQLKAAVKTITDMKASLSKAEKKVKSLEREKLELMTALRKLTEQKIVATKLTSTKSSGVKRCPRSFTNDKKANICYLLVKKSYNYKSAQTYCKKQYSGRLAVLNTPGKFSAVRAVADEGSSRFTFFRKRTSSYWVGSQADRLGKMKWSDGSSVSSTIWARGKPIGKPYQCGELERRKAFKMDDDRCADRNYFVCEFV